MANTRGIIRRVLKKGKVHERVKQRLRKRQQSLVGHGKKIKAALQGIHSKRNDIKEVSKKALYHPGALLKWGKYLADVKAGKEGRGPTDVLPEHVSEYAHLIDASYLSLQDVSLSYDFDSDILSTLGLSGLKIYQY